MGVILDIRNQRPCSQVPVYKIWVCSHFTGTLKANGHKFLLHAGKQTILGDWSHIWQKLMTQVDKNCTQNAQNKHSAFTDINTVTTPSQGETW